MKPLGAMTKYYPFLVAMQLDIFLIRSGFLGQDYVMKFILAMIGLILSFHKEK
jgi:hypothetical protein